MSDHWDRLQDLYLAALEAPPAARVALVRQRAGDDALADEVLEMLAAQAPALLDGSAGDDATVRDAARAALDDLGPGSRVGPYRIVGEVGRGGMGAVYRAERADGAFEQTVALKLVKRGMDSDAVLRRFRAERQILARLEHPGIARVLDGGLAADGRPWLAMEFVEGEPITDYADRHGLSVRQRLALFDQVCEAVGYAHRQLVVHRDLKPSNVLVAEDDAGRPRVKLLDFGIAKVLAGDDADAPLTTLTTPGQLVLTPEYAAPEQVAGGPVSTATDVYALGVVLYELLAGQRPYAFDARTPAVIDHVVRTVEPPRPSTVVAERPPTTGTTADRLRRQLAGDLDTICLTALRKEPDRRYTSVEALADDLARHRDGLPVLARPDTVGYRARKFVGRHRVGLAATVASLAAVALVAALAFARVGAERDRAEAERDLAQRAQSQAEAVTAFLTTDLLRQASPRSEGGPEMTVRELLERGAERTDALDDQPEAQIAVLDAIGNSFFQLNDYPAAVRHQRRVLALRQRLPGTPDTLLVEAYNQVGNTYRQWGKPDSAIAVYEAGLAVARERLGPDHEWVATILNNLTDPYQRTGHHALALATAREVAAIDDRTLPPDDLDRAFSQNNLATALTNRGQFREAEPLFREAARIARLQDNPYLLSFPVANLGWLLTEAGRPDDALPHAREALALREASVGTEEQSYGEAAKFVADALVARGGPSDYAEADSLYRLAETVFSEAVGADHPGTQYVVFGRGELALARDRPTEAARLFRQVLDIRQREGNDDPRQLVVTLLALGDALRELGSAEAAARYRGAHALAEGALPDRDWTRSRARAAWGLASGDEPLYRRGIADLAGRVGAGHPAVRDLCARGRAQGVAAPPCAPPAGR